ncbi:MAG: hypothetical protein DRH08_00510 [Deltaproteobacteria bacterium]|nr:MAG: hypothetical protein DRH08_00510 [Deltaproteobacteria bacterium]
MALPFRWQKLLENAIYTAIEEIVGYGEDQRFIHQPNFATDASVSGDRRNNLGRKVTSQAHHE